jgi:hypothetical protein
MLIMTVVIRGLNDPPQSRHHQWISGQHRRSIKEKVSQKGFASALRCNDLKSATAEPRTAGTRLIPETVVLVFGCVGKQPIGTAASYGPILFGLGDRKIWSSDGIIIGR